MGFSSGRDRVGSLASVFVMLSVFRDFLENFAKSLGPTEYLNLLQADRNKDE